MPTRNIAIYTKGGYQYESITGTLSEISDKIHAKAVHYQVAMLIAAMYWISAILIWYLWPNLLFVPLTALIIWLFTWPAGDWRRPMRSYQQWRGWRKQYRQSIKSPT